MKIKNILAILSFGMVSCVGLEQYPLNSFTDENFWKYPDNVRSALYLGYNQVWSDGYYFKNDVLSDDTYGSRHTGSETGLAAGMGTTSDGRFQGEWNACYQALRTIHTALDNEDNIDVGDPVFKTRMIAELRLMRAFTYLRLTTWYGDVPLFTKNPTLPEAKVVGVTSAAEIKKFIHEELEYAASVLPKNTEIPVAENGRFTCGTAVAIKARAYLLDNDFENCAKECDKLIHTTAYGTYALVEDYNDLFKHGHYGPESIMTIEYATLLGVENVVRGWGAGGYLPQSVGQASPVYSPTQELVNTYRKLDGTLASTTDYEARDKRFYTTIAYNGCTVVIPEARKCQVVGSEGPGKGTYTCYTNPLDEGTIGAKNATDSYDGSQDRTATGYYSLKNYDPTTINSGGSSYKSIMEFRYADILLMYAESMNELGQMSADIWNETIKPLRMRAGFDTGYCAYPSGNFRQIIRDERRCELALEGRRAFDVRRWAVMDNASLLKTGAAYLTSQATGAPFRSGIPIVCQNRYNIKYWFAIPQADREINTNLPQNPGW